MWNLQREILGGLRSIIQCRPQVAVWLIVSFFGLFAPATRPCLEAADLPDTDRVKITPLTSRGDVSLRGVATNDGRTVWISGTGGTVSKSIDGGDSWQDAAPAGAETSDFRDIEILDEGEVVILSVGPGTSSRVYKTIDGGDSWRVTLQNQDEGAFFNGFAFWNASVGLLTSDSTDGQLLVMKTEDAGESWQRVGLSSLAELQEGEAGFAASGTLVAVSGTSAWIATGGSSARVFSSHDFGATWTVSSSPLPSGKPSAGIFSISFRDQSNGVIVGGDYLNPEQDLGNVAWSADGGETWETGISSEAIEQKACVGFLDDHLVLAVGRSGVVVSSDGGRRWRRIESDPYYAFDFDEKSGRGFLVGSDGRVGLLEVTP